MQINDPTVNNGINLAESSVKDCDGVAFPMLLVPHHENRSVVCNVVDQ